MIGDAAILTIVLIVGYVLYSSFKEQGRRRVRITALIAVAGSFVVTYIQQEALLLESLSSVVTIIIGAVWRAGLLVSGLVIVVGTGSRLCRRVSCSKKG